MTQIARAVVRNPARREPGWEIQPYAGRTETEHEVTTIVAQVVTQDAMEFTPVSASTGLLSATETSASS